MDLNKILGLLLIGMAVFDVLVLPRLVPTLPANLRVVTRVFALVLLAGGLALVLGYVRAIV